MAVADLTAARATLALGLTRREGREVVVEQEALVGARHGTVDKLLVELGAQRHRGERHGLTTLEDG